MVKNSRSLRISQAVVTACVSKIYRVTLVFSLLLPACTPAATATPTLLASTLQVQINPSASSRPAPTATRPATATPTPMPEEQPGTLEPAAKEKPVAELEPLLCSPLQGVTFAQLPDTISNPFHPPRLGSDDPHHGVDFADRLEGSQVTLEGRPVQAVLGGRVVAVINNRFPYGNAILIETSLDEVPPDWSAQLDLPSLVPTLPPPPVLTCPPPAAAGEWDLDKRSLYLLYAHLQGPATVHMGDRMDCGQEIGAIGGSGNALNPHLHLETRVGPSGARFTSLAHYDNRATLEEMSLYCTWRVSNLFQLVDPMRLLSLQP